MMRAIIVHCWSGHPNYCWYQSAKQDLEKLGIKTEVLEMPGTDTPKISLWLPKLREAAGKPDEDLYLIGHSIGTVTIMRYLESLPVGTRIGGAVLVAGFTDDLGDEELKNFFPKPLDFSQIKPKAKKFILINSDNDPFVPLKYADILKKELGATLILKPGFGHFSGDKDVEINCDRLPDVAQAIKNILR